MRIDGGDGMQRKILHAGKFDGSHMEMVQTDQAGNIASGYVNIDGVATYVFEIDKKANKVRVKRITGDNPQWSEWN
jgi:hypothetical protein